MILSTQSKTNVRGASILRTFRAMRSGRKKESVLDVVSPWTEKEPFAANAVIKSGLGLEQLEKSLNEKKFFLLLLLGLGTALLVKSICRMKLFIKATSAKLLVVLNAKQLKLRSTIVVLNLRENVFIVQSRWGKVIRACAQIVRPNAALNIIQMGIDDAQLVDSTKEILSFRFSMLMVEQSVLVVEKLKLSFSPLTMLMVMEQSIGDSLKKSMGTLLKSTVGSEIMTFHRDFRYFVGIVIVQKLITESVHTKLKGIEKQFMLLVNPPQFIEAIN